MEEEGRRRRRRRREEDDGEGGKITDQSEARKIMTCYLK